MERSRASRNRRIDKMILRYGERNIVVYMGWKDLDGMHWIRSVGVPVYT